MMDPDLLAARQDGGVLNSVPELAHVAGVVVALQCRPSGGCQAGRGLVRGSEFVQELFDQDGQVGKAVAQGWQVQIEDLDSIVEILTKGAFARRAFERAIAG